MIDVVSTVEVSAWETIDRVVWFAINVTSPLLLHAKMGRASPETGRVDSPPAIHCPSLFCLPTVRPMPYFKIKATYGRGWTTLRRYSQFHRLISSARTRGCIEGSPDSEVTPPPLPNPSRFPPLVTLIPLVTLCPMSRCIPCSSVYLVFGLLSHRASSWVIVGDCG